MKRAEWDIVCKENPDITFAKTIPQEYSYVTEMLNKEGFTHPSPIQVEAIKYGLEGKSIIAQSKSGTGKTLSFLTLLFCKLKPSYGVQCLIVSPTRELSNQIYNVATNLNRQLPAEKQLKFCLLIGGLPIKDDEQLIRTKPDVIIGTVGRVSLHFQNDTLSMANVRLAVIDEADVLIKSREYRSLFGRIRHERAKRPLQVCCYSATFNRTNFAKYTRYLYPCVRINNQCVIKEKAFRPRPKAEAGMDLENVPAEQESKWKVIKQTLNVEGLEQFVLFVEPSEDKSLSLVKMDWIIKILQSVKYEQCIIFYNDKGRGDQIVSEFK
jgi:superfamily II DNA/RNA helicase